MALSPAAVSDVSAQTCDVPWLVLLTIAHNDLDQPIRLTSDGVNTISNGNVFTPGYFDAVFPDNVEGRTPIGSIRIDNTSQELIASLRGLDEAVTVTMQIVRASDPDYIEEEWTDLELMSENYDQAFINGQLTIEDISTEEFPYETFDGRWKGIWP